MSNETTPGWLVYERCVAAFIHEGLSSIDTTVLPNVSLTGEVSGQKRQIDVLVENRWQAIPDSTVVTCGCDKREWASVPESETSGHVGKPESIWLMMREDGSDPIALDRRPIR